MAYLSGAGLPRLVSDIAIFVLKRDVKLQLTQLVLEKRLLNGCSSGIGPGELH